MHSDEFEKAFDSFIDAPEFEVMEAALFQLVRAAFEAGWKGARGELPEEDPFARFLLEKVKQVKAGRDSNGTS